MSNDAYSPEARAEIEADMKVANAKHKSDFKAGRPSTLQADTTAAYARQKVSK